MIIFEDIALDDFFCILTINKFMRTANKIMR